MHFSYTLFTLWLLHSVQVGHTQICLCDIISTYTQYFMGPCFWSYPNNIDILPVCDNNFHSRASNMFCLFDIDHEKEL